MSDVIRRRVTFTAAPMHLILDPRLSDRAFRLWCRLDRYAGADGAAFPSRTTLAVELGCSKPTIDRAIEVLVKTGWLTKERRAAGDVNVYTLAEPDYDTVMALVEQARDERRKGLLNSEDTPPVITDEDTPSSPVMTPLLTGEEEKGASPNEPKGRTPSAPTPSPLDEAADRVARKVHEGTSGSWEYLKVRGIVKSRLKAGATEERVSWALGMMWKSSRALTTAVVQQVLDGVLVPGPDGVLRNAHQQTGRPSKQEERERVIANERERARQAEAAMAAMQEQEWGYAPRAIKGGTP
jgi:DNA-binding transcriptional regulator YhcF (GntR family)